MSQVAFIGYASGLGAQIRGTENGPSTLLHSGILSSFTMPWIWKETFVPKNTAKEIQLSPGPEILPYIEDLCQRVSLSVENSLQNHQFPTVIGGDHTVAIGTWAGVIHHLKAKHKFGLIWIDAHMDAHTMETSLSKAYHGMPLAALLGFGDASLVNMLEDGPLFLPHHVCLIGVRSYEEGEAALLKRLGVRIYFMDEIQKRGFTVILQEALEIVKKNTKGFGLSIDLDAFDPKNAPGVGSPAPNGLRAQEVLPALSLIQEDVSFKALEIVEYNPDRDEGGKTIQLMRDLLLELIPKNEAI